MHARLAIVVLASLSLLGLSSCRRQPSTPPLATGTPHPATPPATPPPKVASPTPRRTPTPPPPAPLPPYVPNKKIEFGKIFNGMKYDVRLETDHGTTASKDRQRLESYVAEVTVRVKVPSPYITLSEINLINPALPEILPQLSLLLETAKVSPVFDTLYRLKVDSIRNNLQHLDKLPTRHNFYDCDTLIELQHPETKRRALFIQADMDIDTDGSDADRQIEASALSSSGQATTSYRWAKKTELPNPFLPGREAKLKKAEDEIAAHGVTDERKAELRKSLASLRDNVHELKKFSFLIAQTDPFIVLPGALTSAKNPSGPFKPAIGDYCLVIYGQKIYPAIVGDAGPMDKVGEASLRIAKQINPKANGENRATNDLKVTYLVFPGTADKMDAPDLEKWQARCEELLNEIGGHDGELFVWENLTKPPVITPPPVAVTPPPAITPPPAVPPTIPAKDGAAQP